MTSAIHNSSGNYEITYMYVNSMSIDKARITALIREALQQFKINVIHMAV